MPRNKIRLILQLSLTLKAEIEAGYLGGRLYGDSIGNLLTVHLLKNYSNIMPQLPVYAGGLSQRSLQQVLEYIQASLDQNLSLDALANVVGISKYYFIELFKQSIGMTPHQSHFTRLFRQSVGVTPRLYRER